MQSSLTAFQVQSKTLPVHSQVTAPLLHTKGTPLPVLWSSQVIQLWDTVLKRLPITRAKLQNNKNGALQLLDTATETARHVPDGQ